MMTTKMNAKEIIQFIGNAEKKTPVKVTYKGNLKGDLSKVQNFDSIVKDGFGIVFGDWADVKPLLENIKADEYVIENDARNSAVPLLDKKEINARIEPGAIIRDQVEIGDNAVIMMGAVINIGAEIGAGTMIDMGAILGGRAIVGNNSHIGAGAVLAGVIEPASAEPVRVGDNVLVGANAVVIEGVQIGDGAVVAAGAIVTEDVPERVVVAGVPARIIKEIDEKTEAKTALEDALRNL
ncbi:2,3,4,5-tetrahydropyridine-2,6-dicarboxylate N-acetyltransferase [Floricoccus penangensis]|uniref:2,3,4,5-tetrahydropyridine-2,6-dicarboxylate N-acetyltransferase n=1 Tax=Floricoccus penangensis TaxID=1859475 RepID=UPI00203CB426|nr:2,3,4,5-tetrahydropyridine-2,6-dicarboxylate N-acetyltransferase [Floricoccus penangensis]URZ87310.1 2,3,4,5-tetrahydropyridine-2,6-dicarboxylate N-acetyltransferase [Floricoccus penangensis]